MVRLRANGTGPTNQLGKRAGQRRRVLTCTSVAENVVAAVAVGKLEIAAAGLAGWS